MANQMPTPEQVIQKMKQTMNGVVPPLVEKAADVMPNMVVRHAMDKGFAMPENGALDEEKRTLIFLGIALANGSQTCIEAMLNKAASLNIGKEKLLETYKIARFAEASRVFTNAETLFDTLR